MANQYINKVIYGNNTLIDLTADTVTPDKVLTGITTHDATGATITGTCNYDVNSQSADVLVGEVLKDKTFYARGAKMTGTMPNNGSLEKQISTLDQYIQIPQGYHDGSGEVSIDMTEKAKIIPANIKEGISILGVTGTLSGGGTTTAQAKTATPTTASQTILPDDGYDYLSQVTVNAIPYVETDNVAGGKTVTIG